jgi:hypothetical protein
VNVPTVKILQSKNLINLLIKIFSANAMVIVTKIIVLAKKAIINVLRNACVVIIVNLVIQMFFKLK